MSKSMLFVSLLLAAAGCVAEVEGAEDPLAESSEALSCQPTIPPELDVPAGNRLAFSLYAQGTQDYGCSVAGPYVLIAPDAKLYNAHGRQKAIHYAGPTWEAQDGSTVKGAKLASAPGAADAIPWLLVQAVEHGGEGRMSRVSYIQRVDTTGGLSPTGSCVPASALVEVPYTATYNFYEPVPGHHP
jgi:hypothetical protein